MNIISYEKRALRVFAKNCREVFEVGVWEPSNGREPEMSRLLPITDTLLHTAPTYLWKHRNILTSDSLPLAANFYICCQHLPLNAATAAAAILFSFELFSAASTFGRWQRRFWDNWPILWITTPSTGSRPFIAVSPFEAVLLLVVVDLVVVLVVVIMVVVIQMRIKSGREQWWCLFPGTDWSAAFPFFSSLAVFVVTCSCSKYNAVRNRDKTLKNYIYSSEYYSHFCSNIYKEMSVTHIQCWFLTCVATYRLFWCSQCAYVADYPGLHIATNQMCWTSW